jgi:hypothetical protein
MSCASSPDGKLHVCYGPPMEKSYTKQEPEVRWCFKCRKHLTHRWVMLFPKEPSYYGPTFYRECESCKEDHSQFPGCEVPYVMVDEDGEEIPC